MREVVLIIDFFEEYFQDMGLIPYLFPTPCPFRKKKALFSLEKNLLRVIFPQPSPYFCNLMRHATLVAHDEMRADNQIEGLEKGERTMITETKSLETAQKGKAGSAKQNVILTVIILIGLVVGVVLTLQLVSPSTQVAGKQVVELARGQQVDAERYTGLANLYASNEEARARAIQADATRWEAVAEHFIGTRVLNAETARWEEMADFYLDQRGASERSLETTKARYTALAVYYTELGK